MSQEAIFYGTGDSRVMMFLINRILRYAQRYIHKLYPDIYLRLKQTGFERINQLQVVVVEKLFYKHSLKGCDATSNKRVECSCLLQVHNFFPILSYYFKYKVYYEFFPACYKFFVSITAIVNIAMLLQ